MKKMFLVGAVMLLVSFLTCAAYATDATIQGNNVLVGELPATLTASGMVVYIIPQDLHAQEINGVVYMTKEKIPTVLFKTGGIIPSILLDADNKPAVIIGEDIEPDSAPVPTPAPNPNTNPFPFPVPTPSPAPVPVPAPFPTPTPEPGDNPHFPFPFFNSK